MKSLVVYFSRPGENLVDDQIKFLERGCTEVLAGKIAYFSGSDLFRLEEVDSYPASYDECSARAEKENLENIMVEIKRLPDISSYDEIYLGFPIWFRTYPRIIASLLAKVDFSDKVVRPFCTNEEGAFGLAEMELSANLKFALLKGGLSIRGKDVEAADEKIKAWLGK